MPQKCANIHSYVPGPIVIPKAIPQVTKAIARERSVVVLAVEAYVFNKLMLPKIGGIVFLFKILL